MPTDTDKEQAEEKMVFTVRNALLAASQEMGRGDEWPVIKDIIHKLMRDWEALKIERRVDEELEIHLYEQLRIMEEEVPNCAKEVQGALREQLKELREIFDAYFEEPNKEAIVQDEENEAMYVKRAKEILKTLE
ncbi:MAG: hypothetical protein FWF23_04240 [Alphaproteobacteria bacterium]|nr:hypothetical protein [Alphaproteobacteria bacterium]MCL2505334.1 hypothetical protein [Alphaproteobacteria bacterium]